MTFFPKVAGWDAEYESLPIGHRETGLYPFIISAVNRETRERVIYHASTIRSARFQAARMEDSQRYDDLCLRRVALTECVIHARAQPQVSPDSISTTPLTQELKP